MKVGVLGCFHETNTFSPGVTTLKNFKEQWIVGKEDFYEQYDGTKTSMGGAIDAAKRYGFELVPLLYTQTMPSATVSQEAIESILKEMLSQLDEKKDELDCLLVILHGAMVSEEWQDVEGVILKRIRELYGNKLIGVTVDLHANISEDMVKYSDLIVGYDTYPHIDAYDRAIETCQLLLKCHNENIKPFMHLERTNLLIAPTLMNTNIFPMKNLMEKTFEFEEDKEVLNVTVAGGFAFSDVNIAGSTIVVTTNNNELKAREKAKLLANWMISHKDEFIPKLYSLNELKNELENRSDFPVALVESSDNVGGGSPGDATHTLNFLIENKIKKFLMVISDPEAVKLVVSKGINSEVSLNIGGKADQKYNKTPLHGSPIYIKGKVKLISDGNYVHKGPYMTGMKASMGVTAVIELTDLESTIVLTEKRVAPWDVNHVRSVGIDPEMYNVIVVKASVAWRTAFGDIVKDAFELDTPGACSSNLSHFDYKNLPANINLVCR